MKIPKDKKDKSNFRPLVVAKVESRIVQRAIHDVLVTVPAIQTYIHTPYSFGGVKKVKEDDLSAVPAAIQAVLNAIGEHGKFIIRSDISNFFTRIPKSVVIKIVADAIDDAEFVELFSRAIAVELENMAQLKSHAESFPLHDVGVAQGNSLSPLLGNLILYDLDRELNKHPDVSCIRYIDDFIIIAPTKAVAEDTFAKAGHRLGTLNMSVSAKKTQRARVDEGFEFLGIEFANGFLRPTKKAQSRMLESIALALAESRTALREQRKSGQLAQKLSLIETLARVGGIMQGWGKHYYFCNDGKCFEHLDNKVEEALKHYLAVYREERLNTDDAGRWRLLGIESLAQIERTPFKWPKKSNSSADKPLSLDVPAVTVSVMTDVAPW